MDPARSLAATCPPLVALRRWMLAVVEFLATKKGMAAALALATHKSPELMSFTTGQLHAAIDLLLRPGAATGALRSDVGPDDLLRTVVGLCALQDGPGWQAQVMRLLDVFLDGLRLQPGA